MATTDIYSTSPMPRYNYVIDQNFNTLISDFDSGAEQRRRLWRFSKRKFELTYGPLSQTDRDTIHSFFRKRSGAYDIFYFYDFQSRKWVDEYMGTAAGSTATFDLHFRSGTSTQIDGVYKDGVVNTAWTFVSGGGLGGANRITFDAAPAAGVLLTHDFTGMARIKGRFDADGFREEIPFKNRYNVVIKITEVQW